MLEKVYLCPFMLCAVLSQGIVGTSLEEDTEKSLNVLVREKRVINRKQGQDVPVNVGVAPYVVSIKKYNRVQCMGSILSQRTAITAARCVGLELSVYTVLSGSTYARQGTPHNITATRMRGHNPSRSSTFLTGIALIIVHPPFTYRISTNAIDLHTTPILTGMHGIISGFGAHTHSGAVCESQYSNRLRSITVPIIKQQDCKNIYSGYFPITDEDVCTYHPKKLCGYTDTGAPLVVDRLLVGVHIGRILADTKSSGYPDVFVLLQNLNYGPWIRQNIVY